MTLEPRWDEVLAFSCRPGKSSINVEMFDQVRGKALRVQDLEFGLGIRPNSKPSAAQQQKKDCK